MRERGGIVAVLFFLTAALLPPAAWADDWATCKNESGDVAIAGCNSAIASGQYKGHELGVLFSNRGLAYYVKKSYDRAIADYNVAIEIDPKYFEGFKNRGDAYYAKKDYDRAIADYDKAIELDPKYSEAINNRGSAYFFKKDYNRAIADYDMAIELDPKNAFTYAVRGLAYEGKGELGRALVEYKAALAIDPKLQLALDGRDRIRKSAGSTVPPKNDAKGAQPVPAPGAARATDMPDNCQQNPSQCSLKVWTRNSFPHRGSQQSVTFANGATLTCTSNGPNVARSCSLK